MSDSYGCSSDDSIKAIIIDNKLIPYIDCDSISTDYLRVKWGVNTIGEEYEIKIGNNSWVNVNNPYYAITGLGFSETVKIEIRIKSDNCINSSIIHECTTYDCLAPSIATVSKEIRKMIQGKRKPWCYKGKYNIEPELM